ncbi:MAG TPA: glycine--tRNA ligase subunit beta, partial [Elusimicrobiota bacterium]|nr:glycine--tRNA ligase subunit beta [Elusimicrobiota bacterium]
MKRPSFIAMREPEPRDFLLEIGVEELPARFVPPALDNLRQLAAAQLETAGLSYAADGLQTWGTPRRLTLFIRALAGKSKDQVQENMGPAVAQAKDADGHWTPAAQGFARSQGVSLEKLEVRETEKGPRLCAVRRTLGVPTEKILPEMLSAVLGKLNFPKNMVWEKSRFSFARPLRWLVALYGSQPVKFEIAGVKAGRKTYGLRVQGGKSFDVVSPAKYGMLLKDRCIVVDPSERRHLIEKQIHQAVKDAHGKVRLDQDGALLDEVVNLVEHPVAILGKFDEKYLALPPEVLVTSMKKHQKFFPVYAADGRRLTSRFVGIRNGVSENQAVVREGYERVLAARLADAAFFYSEDKKKKLEDNLSLLQGITFLAPLNLLNKTTRVEKLIDGLLPSLPMGDDRKECARRIARLAKTDLLTAMVGEFPELQGVMGRIYASEHENPEVARGIEQHYWPLAAEGDLPDSDSAAVVSVADKLDSLAGNYLVGKVPSGSQDPYGLRRAAVGVLRIVSDRRWRMNLSDIALAAMREYPFWNEKVGPPAHAQLVSFLRQRWAALMAAAGFRFDEVEAAASAGFGDVVEVFARLKALRDIRSHAHFASLSVAFKRADNILKQAEKQAVKGYHIPRPMDGRSILIREELLRDGSERALFSAVVQCEEANAPLLEAGDYAAAYGNLVAL